eukprot:TRINITY_DN10395_c0_g1_i3.p2 TRINITY_DN10395_c0_g1~~TRINITY_DN10395_c0_g1_i3.p2  ORF type:complete len:309 (+),score=77.76 TRINITY_DN10395_c0_g1_i3:1431-2357(+)
MHCTTSFSACFHWPFAYGLILIFRCHFLIRQRFDPPSCHRNINELSQIPIPLPELQSAAQAFAHVFKAASEADLADQTAHLGQLYGMGPDIAQSTGGARSRSGTTVLKPDHAAMPAPDKRDELRLQAVAHKAKRQEEQLQQHEQSQNQASSEADIDQVAPTADVELTREVGLQRVPSSRRSVRRSKDEIKAIKRKTKEEAKASRREAKAEAKSIRKSRSDKEMDCKSRSEPEMDRKSRAASTRAEKRASRKGKSGFRPRSERKSDKSIRASKVADVDGEPHLDDLEEDIEAGDDFGQENAGSGGCAMM